VKRILILSAIISIFLVIISPVYAQEVSVTEFLSSKANVLERQHKKAGKALLRAVKDYSFSDYFNSIGDEDKLFKAKKGIEKVSLMTQKHFRVEEMCLIAIEGNEIARIVGSKIAPDEDLSPNEGASIFFKPSIKQLTGTVYISPIYISDDVHKWVKSYTTPVDVNHRRKAFLHYEHGLDFFQKLLNSGMSHNSDTYLLALNSEGYILFDSRKKIDVKQKGEKENKDSYFEKLSVVNNKLSDFVESVSGKHVATGSFTDGSDKYDIAYQEVMGDWRLVAVRKR